MDTVIPELIDVVVVPKDENKPKKKKCRCPYKNGKTKCKKKLKLTDMACRCGKRFCNLHRLPENHNCSINYAQIKKDIYLANLGGGQVSKIEVI